MSRPNSVGASRSMILQECRWSSSASSSSTTFKAEWRGVTRAQPWRGLLLSAGFGGGVKAVAMGALPVTIWSRARLPLLPSPAVAPPRGWGWFGHTGGADRGIQPDVAPWRRLPTTWRRASLRHCDWLRRCAGCKLRGASIRVGRGVWVCGYVPDVGYECAAGGRAEEGGGERGWPAARGGEE
jgi:hypothetical protein